LCLKRHNSAKICYSGHKDYGYYAGHGRLGTTMKLQLFPYFATAIATTLLIAGCGQIPRESAVISDAPKIQAAQATEVAPPSNKIEQQPTRAIPADSIYPLLLAEFALRNRQYHLALENYLGQSEILEDAGLNSLTTKLAQFLKDDRAALQAASQWVTLQPQNLEANYTLANLLGHNYQPLAALPYMATVLRQGGRANFTSLAVTALKLDQSIQLETLSEIEQLLIEFPDNTELKLARAVMLEEQQQYAQALSQIRELLKNEPDQLQAVVLEARILQVMGKKNSFSRLLNTLQQQPDNDRLRLQYARLLTQTDLNAAKEQFTILVNNSPDNADLIYSHALINWELEEFDTASEYFHRLLSLNNHTNEAHFYLGKHAENNGDNEAALEHYLLVTLGNDFVAAIHRAASIWLDQGKNAELDLHFEQLRKDNPRALARLFLIEAEILLKHHLLSDANAVLSRGIDDFPDAINLRYARSLISEKLGDIALMEQDLRSIISQDPNNTTALNALGYGLTINTNRYQEAYELLQRATQISPDEPAILDSLGWVQFKLGMTQQALANLQKAYQSFPDPEVAAHLGEVLWSLGYTREADSLWSKSLKENPGNALLLEVIKRHADSN